MNKRLIIGLCFFALLAGTVYATDGSNPFSQATEKIESGTDHLIVVARVIFALVVVFMGIGAMLGYFRKETAFRVIVGAIVIASSTEIANFFLKG